MQEIIERRIVGVTEHDVRAAMRNLAREHKERVNPRFEDDDTFDHGDGGGCAYSVVQNGEHRACIVGQWLLDLGVVEEGELADCTSGADLVVTDLTTAQGNLRIEMEPTAVKLLRRVQSYCDGGTRGGIRQPWGNLVEDIEGTPLNAPIPRDDDAF